MRTLLCLLLSTLGLVNAFQVSAVPFSPLSQSPAARSNDATQTATVSFSLSGLEEGSKANVTIGSNEYLDLMTVDSNGTYSFENVLPGEHTVRVEASGYISSNPLKVIVSEDGSMLPAETLKFSVTKIDPNANDGDFHFVWEENGSVSGYTTTANVNKPAEIEFMGKMIVPADVPSQQLLLNNFQMILSDEELPWTEEYAYRLLMTMRTFLLPDQNSVDLTRPLIKVILSDSYLPDDITVTPVGNNQEVRISKEAFYYANPYFVRLDGVKGRFFSKRLHHALTELVTDYGRDTWTANEILKKRFGCEIMNLDYAQITAGITNESDIDFQMFVPSEIVAIINMLEELPEGFHKTDHLKYLLRRRNDRPHPLYPEAAAVSWTVDNGYIEFMEKAFGGNNQQFDTQRLILHEKTHFLWAFTFNDDIKRGWIEVGQWYEDPNSSTGWLTNDQTGFVSEYAHAVNPDEDMAESVAYYLKNPEWLNSRNPAKYEYIRDYIMHGTRYITQIRPDLTFEVFNLWPDYDYPGKIIKLEVTCTGAPDEDKEVKIDIWLNHVEGCMDGADGGWTRILSPTFFDQNGKPWYHYRDCSVNPVDGDLYHLSGSFNIDKNCKGGEWTSWGIELRDANGNQRYNSNIADYIWRLDINNADEDLVSPGYVPNSLYYELTEIDGDGEAEGHKLQRLRAHFKGHDDRGITMASMGFSRGNFEYTWGAGTHLPEPVIDGWIFCDMIIPPYFPSGEYYASSVMGVDNVFNEFFIRFPEDEPIKMIDIKTADPDYEAPELDLNRISVYAEPTNPEAPNGETIVSLSFFTRDNISGIEYGEITLRDPQGGHFSLGFNGLPGYGYYDGDPTLWAHHLSSTILPVGSVPGIWGVESITVTDKAGNERTFSFVETLIFEPDDDESNYVLFADMDENDMLSIHLESNDGTAFGFNYRIIHEATGEEISGDQSSKAPYKSAPREKNTALTVDTSSLPDGDLIVITNIYDSNGNVETSKSTRVQKGIILGDIDKNGYIDGIDLNVMISGVISPENSTISLKVADMNNDGVIDGLDLNALITKIINTQK